MLIHYLISRFTLPLILACLVSILAPCTVSAAQDAIPQSLKAQLDATSEGFSRRMPPEVSRNIEAAINDLTATGVLDRALKKGDHAPDFTLPDAAGNMVNLASLLKQGPVVLTWYRGNWWPYCNLQLHDYQKILNKIHAAGAELVAVSPVTPDNSLDMEQKNALKFKVLSDAGNGVAREYGLVYRIPERIRALYQQGGMIDLSKYNGDDTMELPLAVTYVVDTDGIIKYAFVEADYRRRAETSDVLEAVLKLTGKEE